MVREKYDIYNLYLFSIDGMIHGRKSGTSGQHGYRRYSNKNEFNYIMNIKHGPWAEPSTLKNENGVSGNSFYGTPYFGETNTEVLVQEGNHAFFHCPVHNIRNQTVSPLVRLSNTR